MIRAEFDAAALAQQMEAGGAAVLSVLTDEKFFQGSLENLRRASAAVSIPCLRKDFMVDEFQVLEARANGADAILLIVAALTDAELRTLRDAARRRTGSMCCARCMTREELERALALDCECVGVNSRDLRTFEVSLDRACELAAQLPADRGEGRGERHPHRGGHAAAARCGVRCVSDRRVADAAGASG